MSVQIHWDMLRQVQTDIGTEKSLLLVKKTSFPEQSATSIGQGLTVELIVDQSESAGERPLYQQLHRRRSVIIPARKAEVDVLKRYRGVMSEVFPGSPLRVKDIDEAMRKIRKRD